MENIFYGDIRHPHQDYFHHKPIAMQEKQRIITVIILVLIYNLVDQYLLRSGNGIDIWSVIISIIIAIVVYLALIYFFGKKHMN